MSSHWLYPAQQVVPESRQEPPVLYDPPGKAHSITLFSCHTLHSRGPHPRVQPTPTGSGTRLGLERGDRNLELCQTITRGAQNQQGCDTVRSLPGAPAQFSPALAKFSKILETFHADISTFVKTGVILVCSGSSNKTAQTGWPKQQNLGIERILNFLRA